MRQRENIIIAPTASLAIHARCSQLRPPPQALSAGFKPRSLPRRETYITLNLAVQSHPRACVNPFFVAHCVRGMLVASVSSTGGPVIRKRPHLLIVYPWICLVCAKKQSIIIVRWFSFYSGSTCFGIKQRATHFGYDRGWTSKYLA